VAAVPVTDDDFDPVEYDAVNILALPLWRQANRRGVGATYSNGTEHDFAAEAAEDIFDLGPMLHRVVTAGIKALADDAEYEAYACALAIGDHEEIARLEGVRR
jgi:hypothetical protein